ncbi:MAG: hypothetical protein Q8R38_01770, partial [Candidatus Omnitrophota bacterium]|nr:hypothetical protein [Candidatus Omnitrophota bacterium]
MMNKYFPVMLFLIVLTGSIIFYPVYTVYTQEGQEQDPSQIQTQSQPKVSDTDGKISLDLKGIDIVELLRVLSLKTGLT